MRHRAHIGDPLTKILAIRVTEEEHKKIKLLAFERGRTMTSFILEALRNYIREKT